MITKSLEAIENKAEELGIKLEKNAYDIAAKGVYKKMMVTIFDFGEKPFKHKLNLVYDYLKSIKIGIRALVANGHAIPHELNHTFDELINEWHAVKTQKQDKKQKLRELIERWRIETKDLILENFKINSDE